MEKAHAKQHVNKKGHLKTRKVTLVDLVMNDLPCPDMLVRVIPF